MFFNFSPTLLSGVLQASSAFASTTFEPQLADFSFAMPPNLSRFQNYPSAHELAKLLPLEWLQSIGSAYESTSVGKAFLEENNASDWQLVSVRMSPCVELFPAVGEKYKEFCWPQIRQIWQPFSKNNSNGSAEYYFADDRAIQITHDFHNVETAMASQELLQKMRTNFGSISESDIILLRELKQKSQLSALNTFLNLRSSWVTEKEMKSLDVRTEFSNELSAREFVDKLSSVLKQHAPANKAKAVNSFSLPQGKQSASIDEWVFLQMQPKENVSHFGSANITALLAVPQVVYSRKNGMPATPPLLFSKGTQSGDDEFLVEFLLDNPLPLAKEIHDRTLFLGHDLPEIRQNIENPNVSSRFHVSCISCHKLNGEKFNFHNFSYFQQQPVTVSPRTTAEAKAEIEIWKTLASKPIILNPKK